MGTARGTTLLRSDTARMSERLIFLLQKLMRRMWVRCALFSSVAVLAVAMSELLGPLIPDDTATKFGADSIGSLLNILATSMLTVAVFSASTMVASFGAVATGATPRAAQLFVEDHTIQNTLATFIGAFLYSIIALVGLNAHIYGGGGRLVLFGFTVAILLVVVMVLLRWLDFLSVLGRMNETIYRVQKATTDAMDQRLHNPWLGGVPQAAGLRGPHTIFAPTTGFVQHVSMDILQECAEKLGGSLHVHVLPGAFVEPSIPIASSDTPIDEARTKKISDAVLIGAVRTFDHDPRFGMVVLAEIATRALSPAVNDPGTAHAIVAAIVKSLVYWVQHQPAVDSPPEIRFNRVTAPALHEAGMLQDVFLPLSRYGARSVELGCALQLALSSIRRQNHVGFNATLKELSDYAIAQAVHADMPAFDVQRLREAAGQLIRPDDTDAQSRFY